MKKVLILLFFLTSFAHAQDHSDDLVKFDSWLASAFENKQFSNRNEVQSLGKPISEKINIEQPNRIGGPLENVQYQFSGLNLCLLRETSPAGKVWPYSILVNTKDWVVGKNIRVGESVSLLKPFEKYKDKETNEYCGHVNCMKIESTNNIITSIHIELEVD